MRLLFQRHAICVTIFVYPILITYCENSDEYKEVSNRRLTDQIAEKAKQTVVDISEVMKSQQSVLECDGKKCPNNNIFVFYQCCESVPKECCWHIRYWLTSFNPVVHIMDRSRLEVTNPKHCQRSRRTHGNYPIISQSYWATLLNTIEELCVLADSHIACICHNIKFIIIDS
ncbi:hypothetical protein DINM_021215 [Dirofilaria immitis]|nr:hypothetical protein [Dirofilaria immitis]